MSKRLLGMGDIRLSFTAPSSHDTVIMPQRIFFIDASETVLDGRDLGEPVRLAETPTIRGVPMSARPTFAVAQAHMRIQDHEKYRRTCKSVSVLYTPRRSEP